MMIAKHVRELEGYVPGEQPKDRKVVKLNTNENPYPPSSKVTAVLKNFDLDRLRRYPDPDCTELRQALAKLNGTSIDRVFVGNGSDEILALSAKAFVENDEGIASLDPSYSLYQTLAAIRSVKWIGANKPSAKTLPPKTALFLWTNPNAPTGEFVGPKTIANFARAFKGVVIVDEAYGDFARDNCMALATAKGNRNLIVMRTFSKSYSLAGLRVGYCIGPKTLIDALYKIKDSYNVDAIAQAVALAALKDQAHLKRSVKKVIAERKRLSAALEKRGWDVIPSESNFIFAEPPKKNAAEIFQQLKGRHIYVRYFSGPKTANRLRVTIGTHEQMNILLKTLDELN